jgi:hypothetical protein
LRVDYYAIVGLDGVTRHMFLTVRKPNGMWTPTWHAGPREWVDDPMSMGYLLGYGGGNTAEELTKEDAESLAKSLGTSLEEALRIFSLENVFSRSSIRFREPLKVS